MKAPGFFPWIGRAWTLSELELLFRWRREGHLIGTIAALLDRRVEEIKAVAGIL